MKTIVEDRARECDKFSSLCSLCSIAVLAALVFTANAATPPAGVAPVLVPQEGFTIGGELSASPAGAGDWLARPGQPGSGVLADSGAPLNPSLTFHFTDPFDKDTDFTFVGGLKWTDDPRRWKWTSGKASPKTDINNVLMHLAEDGEGHTWLIVAADRLDTSGDSYIDFEFLQHPVTRRSDGTFDSAGLDGGRTKDDLLLSMAFVGGGTVADFYAWRWVARDGGFGYADATASLPQGRLLMVANTQTILVPFGAFGQSNYAPNAFAEAAIDLTALLGNFDPCLSIGVKTILVKTKASQSDPATINDFIDPIQIDNLRLGPSANAGPDQMVCTDARPTEFAIEGTATSGLFPSISTTWSVVSGNAKIAASDSLKTRVYVTSESATLRLTVRQANGCVETDDLTLTSVVRPTAPIAGPTVLCPFATAVFSGPTGFSTYSWSITGDGVIAGPTDSSNVSVTSGQCGANFVLTLNVVSNVCSASSSIAVVMADVAPPSLVSPPDLRLEYPADSSTNATGVATASDACGNVSVKHSDAVNASCGNTKVIMRSWTATDN